MWKQMYRMIKQIGIIVAVLIVLTMIVSVLIVSILSMGLSPMLMNGPNSSGLAVAAVNSVPLLVLMTLCYAAYRLGSEF